MFRDNQKQRSLLKSFSKNGGVRLITYNNYHDVKITHVFPYDLKLSTGMSFQKLPVLLAYPTCSHNSVQHGIRWNGNVAQQKLQPVENKQDRPIVDYTCEKDDTVSATLRNGLVATGVVIYQDKYTKVLRVGDTNANIGKNVLMYNHGLYAFEVIQGLLTDYQDTPNHLCFTQNWEYKQ